MKKDLIKLIDSRKEIEKMFHPFGGGMGTSFERISDVPEFQNWLQEIKLELQGIYDRTHDTFAVSYTHLDVYKRQAMWCVQRDNKSSFC